jgi:hypothetical protein
MRIGLVGCVKSKAAEAKPAKGPLHIYTSALFRGARRAVERTCDTWFILSAAHGLVSPDRLLAPYERTLNSASPSSRRKWAAQVLQQIDEAAGLLQKISS